MKRILKLALAFCMLASLFVAVPAAAEDTWEEITANQVSFSTENTPFTGNGTDYYSLEDTADGLKITKTKDQGEGVADPRIDTTISFETPLDAGEYYLELEYEEHLNAGQLWGSFFGNAGEGITFTIRQAATTGLAGNQTLDGATTGAWLDSYGYTLPSHTSGQPEKLGFQYETEGQSILTYVDQTRAQTDVFYPRASRTTKLTSLKLELQNMKKDGYIVLKGVKIWQKQQAPAEEGTWQEVKTYSFTQEAEEAGNYTVPDNPTEFEKTYQADGMVLKKLTDNASIFSEFIYTFDTALDNGKYYVEFEYTENAPAKAQLNATLQSSTGTEAVTFSISKGNKIGAALRYSKTGSDTEMKRNWLTASGHPEEQPTHNTNHEKERLGVVYDTADLSLVFYVDGKPVTGKTMYAANDGATNIGRIAFKFQQANQNDSFTLHNIKTYQYVEGQAGQSDAEKLAADMATVTENSILGGQSKDSVTTNLTLPTSPMVNGTTVTWESTNTAVLANNGTVKPAEQDAQVTFTGHFVNETASQDMVLDLTVKGTGSAQSSDWKLIDTLPFTQEAESAGKYTVPDNPTEFEKTYQADGMVLKKLTDNSDIYSEFIYTLDTVLSNGKYYVEFEYTENAPTNAQLNATLRSNTAKEAVAFGINRMETINAALRYDNKEGTQRAWLASSHPEERPPHNTNHEKERLGVVYDTSDQSLVFYVDGKPVTGRKMYVSETANTNIGQILFKYQSAMKDDYFIFHNIKTYQYVDSTDPEDAANLEADMENVKEETILGGQLANNVTANLTLPVSPMANGTTVTWESTNTAVLETNGTVHRQAQDTQVTFTGHFVNGTASQDLVLELTVKGTESGESSDWILWNDIVFDSLESPQYSLTTNADYTNEIQDGALTFVKNNTNKTDWISALTVNIPSDHPIEDGTYYMELTFQTNVTGSGAKLIANYYNGGNYLLSMTGENGMGLAANTDPNASGTGGWLGNEAKPAYTQGEKMVFGVLYDTDDSSLIFCKDGVPASDTKYYTRSPGVKKMDKLVIGMQGASSEGQFGRVYSFKVWKLDDTAFMADYNYLTLDKLTDEPANMITKNLNALPTSLPNGTTVAWNISDSSVLAMDGTISPMDHDVSVKLTATLMRGSLTDTKEFYLTVLEEGKAERYLYVSSDTFDTEESIAPWNVVGANATIEIQDGRLAVKRDAENQDVSGIQYFVSQDADNPFAVTGEKVVLEYQIQINENLREWKGELLDTENNVLSELMITDAGSSDDTSATMAITYLDGGAETQATVDYTDNTAANVKYEINTQTGAMQVYVNTELVAEGTVKNGAKNFSAFRFSTGYEDRYGWMWLDNVNVLVESSNHPATRVALDAANLTFEQIKGESRNKEGAIIGNLSPIQTGYLGSTIAWGSNNTAALANDGTITRSSVDQPVTYTATLTYETESQTVPFELTIRGIDENNLAARGELTASSGRDTVINANDTLLDTAWISGANNPYLRVDVGEAKILSQVILHEMPVDGNNLVTGFVIEVSNNGSDWETVAEGTTVGSNKIVDFLPVEARYVRYRVTSQNTGKTGLYEIEIYNDPTDSNRVKADIEWLKDNYADYMVSGPITLPTVGKFGSTISWVSSRPDILSNDGTIFTKPQSNEAFVTTATVESNNYSENTPIRRAAEGTGSTTPGTGSGSSGSSGGGGGGSLSGSGNLVNVVTSPTPAPTPTPTTDPGNYGSFRDVPKDSWSYEYVEALAEKGIVNGYDGLFNPGSSVTREEFVKMLLGALGIEATQTESDFSDVNANEWYVPYVATAAQLGIVGGIGDGVFGVGQTITRQDMAVMVQRALEATGKTLAQDGEQKVFEDADSISSYAVEAVELLVRANVISGDEQGYFHPNDSLTREQAAKIICLSGGVLNEE